MGRFACGNVLLFHPSLMPDAIFFFLQDTNGDPNFSKLFLLILYLFHPPGPSERLAGETTPALARLNNCLKVPNNDFKDSL